MFYFVEDMTRESGYFDPLFKHNIIMLSACQQARGNDVVIYE